MRLLELQLSAFGPFTNVSLDLSAGTEGLHIVYGPNEAGKSTTLRAITDLLYGIPLRTTDDFRHEMKRLRIGGRLRCVDGSELPVIRRKGRENTLLDPDGQPLDEAVLTRCLQGISRDHFQSLFGISHSSLVEGGREIVEGKGELGQTLFAAGTGIRQVRAVLASLENEANQLYVLRGKEQPVNTALKRYETARGTLATAIIPGRKWQEDVAELATDEQKRDAVLEEMQRLRREVARLSRYRAILPKLALREDRQKLLQQLGEVVLLPETAVDTRKNAQQALQTAEERLSQAKQDIGRLVEALDALAVPDALLAQDVAINALFKRLGGIMKAAEDRPGLIGQQKQIQTDVDRMLHDLPQAMTQDDVNTLLLDTVARTRIRRLAQQHPVLTSAVDAVRKSLQTLEGDQLNGKAKLDKLPPPRDFTEFRLLVERIHRRGDIEQTATAQQVKMQGSYAQIDRALKKQAQWTGTRDDLETLLLPSEMTINQFDGDYREQRQSEDRLTEYIREVEETLTKHTHDLEDLQQEGAIPTTDELERIRQERDAGWMLVYRAWIDGEDVTADAQRYDADLPLHTAFPRRVASADELADHMRQEANRVARQTHLLAEQRRCREAITSSASAQEQQVAARQALDTAWAACWAPLGITPRSPQVMRAWLTEMREILRQAETAREVEQTITQAAGEIEEAKRVLVITAEDAGMHIGMPTETLVVLMARGQTTLTANDATERERERLENELDGLSRKLSDAHLDVTMAEQNLANWQKDWASAIADLRLPITTPADEVVATLGVLEEIRGKLHDAADKDGRIAGIDRDAEEYATTVTGLLKHIATDLQELPVVQAAGELHARLVKAKTDAAKRDSMLQQIEEKRRIITDAEEVIRNRTEELAELCRQAACTSVNDLPDAEEKSKQARKWQAEIEDLERQIIELGEGEALADIVTVAATLDKDALPGQIDEMDRESRKLEIQRSELDQAIGASREAMRVMNGGDAAAVAANELQQVVAEIRDHADQYLRLRLAAALIRQQIEAYRQGNQTPVLKSAGEIFAALTLGSFAGVETDYDEKDRPVLIGVRADGERVYVEGMSDGTCDQLYLALRLAALGRHLDTSEALPFIIDDILISFDDRRAIAALQVLAEFSRKTQVILFTHHTRLLELAQHLAQNDCIFIHHLDTAVNQSLKETADAVMA